MRFNWRLKKDESEELEQETEDLNDPYAEIKQIYRALDCLGGNTTIYTCFGNHNFELKGSEYNEKSALYSMANWLESLYRSD